MYVMFSGSKTLYDSSSSCFDTAASEPCKPAVTAELSCLVSKAVLQQYRQEWQQQPNSTAQRVIRRATTMWRYCSCLGGLNVLDVNERCFVVGLYVLMLLLLGYGTIHHASKVWVFAKTIL